MPHIIVEHTGDVKGVEVLVKDLHHSLAGQETVTLGAIKSRSLTVHNAFVGEVEKGSMVHVTVKLLPGRSDDLLSKMTSDLKAVVQRHLSSNTSITVEAVTLHQESYQK